jgi:hypothetical protein
MIDRQALEDVAARHLQQMALPSGVSLVLHLHNGEKYNVNGFAEFLETYCVVLVYPQEPLSPEDLGTTIPKNRGGSLVFDRLMLPYQAIGYVTITGRDAEKRSAMGFTVEGN